MQTVQSRTIGPTSDLVVLAPWRSDIIGADEAILPATRFAVTFRAMFQIRRMAREATETPAFSDPIERLEQVHSFRMAGRRDGMLMSVTYDFGWEAYMRSLWGAGGAFLDLLLCNCADYRLTRTTNVEPWAAWVRAREVSVSYFYAAYPLTVADMQGLAQAEQAQRDTRDAGDGDRKLAGFAITPAEAAAAKVRASYPEEAAKQALRIMSAMHRLTRFYGADIRGADLAGGDRAGPPLADDALTLLRATRGLLDGWCQSTLTAAQRAQYGRELAWFNQTAPARPQAPPLAAPDPANIQRGILSSFDRDGAAITHGALLHLMVSDPVAARNSLKNLNLDSEAGGGIGDGIFRNIGFSFGGLERLGLPPAFLDSLPAALREGAASRGGSVGDVRAHHPARWQRLPRNWRPGAGFQPDAPRQIDPEIVDAVIQLRTVAPGRPTSLADPDHPLMAAIKGFAAQFPGWVLLSVEGLNPAHPHAPGLDHFGVRDGIGQPVVGPDAGEPVVGPDAGEPAPGWSNTVPASAMVVGNDGAAAAWPLAGSSYLAIRRMPMRVTAFDAMLAAGAADTGLDPDIIAAKIVGRSKDGTPLVDHLGENAFDFESDPDGERAPRQSHARRLNPRTGVVPRIMRRGMGFGPPASGPFAGDAGAERGTMFMAYCADLAEQYEVVLRWMNGANSSRIGSYLADPLCGVPDAIKPRTYRFVHDGKVHRVALPPTAGAPVGLSWSLYLLAPSLDLVRRIGATAPEPGVLGAVSDAALATARQLVKNLLRRNAGEAEWRNLLDEPGALEAGVQTAVWKVIRDDHRGVLRAHDSSKPTKPDPLAPNVAAAGADLGPKQDLVLVGRIKPILEVIRDDGRNFSVRGAGRRIAPSIEKFHLGLDAFTSDYQREGPACNAAIAGVREAEAFDAARAAAAAEMRKLLAGGEAPVRVDIVRQLLEPVVAAMAPGWFGLPDGRFISPGASDWREIVAPGTAAGDAFATRETTLFPGDFWNSSRYAFNPFEAAETRRLSAIHGQAILNAAHGWINACGRDALTGSISVALAGARSGVPGETGLAFPTNHDLARGIVGAMLGWVATTLGNGARLFNAWTTTPTLQRLQIAWTAVPAAMRGHAAAVQVFDAAIKQTIALAPVPECKWREAATDTRIGRKKVRRDSKLVLGLASAARQCPGDSYIWFGQAEPGQIQAPHGCPGRDIALGVLLGVVAAVTETVQVRATGARLEIEISPLNGGARPATA